MKPVRNKATTVLRNQGYRLTPQRKIVLDAIAGSHEHLSPLAIWEKVRVDHPHIGLVTVYRTLEILTKLGLLCEVHVSSNSRSYLMKPADQHHHHLICSGCGQVVDFVDCGLDKLEARLGKETGYAIDEHRLEFFGKCRNCHNRPDRHSAKDNP